MFSAKAEPGGGTEHKERARAEPGEDRALDERRAQRDDGEARPAEHLKIGREARVRRAALGDGAVDHHVGRRDRVVDEKEEEARDARLDQREAGQCAEGDDADGARDDQVARLMVAADRHRVRE